MGLIATATATAIMVGCTEARLNLKDHIISAKMASELLVIYRVALKGIENRIR